MATAVAEKLTLAEFERLYGDCKPHYEYWYGEAIQKPMATWLHGLLEKILMLFLDELGFESSSEVTLRIDPDVQPVPDVIATSGPIETVYPESPVDVVVEILSPDDRFSRVSKKCSDYARLGIPNILVIDPEQRSGWQWSEVPRGLHEVKSAESFSLQDGRELSLAKVFAELDRRIALKRSPATPAATATKTPQSPIPAN